MVDNAGARRAAQDDGALACELLGRYHTERRGEKVGRRYHLSEDCA